MATVSRLKSTACAIACALVLSLSCPSTSHADEPIHFDIASQPLSTALQSFAAQAKMQILYRQDVVAGETANELVGNFDKRAALQRLVEGTGLEIVFSTENAATIRMKSDVSAKGPEDSAEIRLAQTNESTAQTGSSVAGQGADEVPTASEATTGGTLEEVVVTAQKRAERLIDVPISITALSGDKLTEAHINNLQDLSFAVPSMSTAEVGPGRQVITVRGLGGTRGNGSLTGIYLDEMPVSGLQDGFLAQYIDLSATDLERVEVLKGPQGTLFGEGAVGGAVRFITKDPNLVNFGGKISGSLFDTAGGGASGEATAVLNLPVVEERLGFRTELAYEKQSGWIDRVGTVSGPVIDEDFNESEILDARVKGLWKPAENLAIKGLVVIHRGEGDGTNIVNLAPRDDSRFIIEFDPTVPTGFTDDYELYNLTATYDLGFAQLLSSTSYSDMSSVSDFFQRKPLLPAPNPGFQEIFQYDYSQDSESFSQELRLSSAEAGPFKWTLGGYFRDAALTRRYPSGYDFWRFGLPVNAAGLVRPGLFEVGFKDKNESEALAAFGDISYSLTPRLEIGGGVRYFEEDRTRSGIVQEQPTFVAAPTLSGSFHRTTYRTYVSFALADDARVYGSVATGFRSGGFNTATIAALGGPATFAPETVTSYELGAKMSLADRRISVQAALFQSDYTDIQLNSIFIAPDGTPRNITGNPGEAEIKGFELELNWLATDRLTLGLNGDVIDAELTEVDTRVLIGGVQQFQIGDPIDLVPDYSVGVSIDYRVDWAPSMPGYVRLQYNEQGKNTTVLRTLGALEPITHTPVLNFLNASVSLNARGWDYELFGRNLLDEFGALRTGGGIDPQARPRTFGIRVTKAF